MTNFLGLALINMTHVHQKNGYFVRMGQANVPGFISLNELRKERSLELAKGLSNFDKNTLSVFAPNEATWYCIKTKFFIFEEKESFFYLTQNGKELITNPKLLQNLIYLAHI